MLGGILWDAYMATIWHGRNEADICAQLTQISAEVWSETEAATLACRQRILQEFNAYVVSIGTLILIYFMWTVLRGCVHCTGFILWCWLQRRRPPLLQNGAASSSGMLG